MPIESVQAEMTLYTYHHHLHHQYHDHLNHPPPAGFVAWSINYYAVKATGARTRARVYLGKVRRTVRRGSKQESHMFLLTKEGMAPRELCRR